MNLNNPTSNMSLSMDVRSLDSLKSSAAKDGRGSIKEAARQLESLFMQELMKPMRWMVPIRWDVSFTSM